MVGLDEWMLCLTEFKVHLVGSVASLLISLGCKLYLDLNFPCLNVSCKAE